MAIGAVLVANLAAAYAISLRFAPAAPASSATPPPEASTLPAARPSSIASADPPPPAAAPSSSSDARALRPGPWGDLDATEVEIEPPGDSIRPEQCPTEIPAWTLTGYGKERALRLVRSLELPDALRSALERTMDCAPGGSRGAERACVLKPDLAVLGALSPVGRALVYDALAAGPGLAALHPVRRKRAAAERWVESIAVPADVRAQIHERLVPRGDDMIFADLPLLCARLRAADKVALLRAVTVAPSLVVRLHVAEHADVSRIASYWGEGGRREEALALLVSLANAPGGGVIDVSHLMPPFPRSRVLAYPAAGTPAWDGTASALAFFAVAPAERPLDERAAREALERDYVLVPRESGRLGDVVEIGRPGGAVLERAAFVADDVVFTKASASPRSPWLLRRLGELVVAALGEAPAEVSLLRKRDHR